MLEGNIHLSHDLIRLGFVKLFVFLTRPISATYTDDLLKRYKRAVMDYREKYGWVVDLESSARLAGMGIGAERIPAEDDFITMNYLNLARSLDFLRSNNSWTRFAYIFSSLYADESGTPVFFDRKKLDEIMTSEGLVASFKAEEKPIFASALLSADIDGSISLLKCLSSQERNVSEIIDSYFPALANWYREKAQFQVSPEKRYRDLQDANKKIKKGRTNAYEQGYTRLQFLRDLGFVYGDDHFRLTEKGARLSELAMLPRIPFGQRRSSEDVPNFLKSELHLRNEIATLYSEGLKPPSPDEFDEIFEHTCRFYSKIGMVLFSYENVFLATSAIAIKRKTSLDLALFKSHTDKMVSEKRIVVSDTGRGERYIKLLK